jgi:hypothetical protein
MSPASLLRIQPFISKCHIEVKKHAFPEKYQTGDAEINAMRNTGDDRLSTMQAFDTNFKAEVCFTCCV